MSDTIYRQDVLNELDGCDYELKDWQRWKLKTMVRDIPSAQPEPLTDKEQRIFLAAMSKEEKVCKEVDDEFRYCREPYEDSLVRICHEIMRKVKGTLWS